MSSGKEICFMMHDGDVSLRQAHGVSGTQVMRMHKVGEWEVNVAALQWLCNLSAWRFVVILLRYSDSLDCEHGLELAVDKIMSSTEEACREGGRQDRLHRPGLDIAVLKCGNRASQTVTLRKGFGTARMSKNIVSSPRIVLGVDDG
jgi:hypothetical protein